MSPSSPRRLSYQDKVKREALALILPLRCCREAFLGALGRRSGSRILLRLPRSTAKTLRGKLAEMATSTLIMSGGTRRVHFTGTPLTEIRRRVRERLKAPLESGRAPHCHRAFLVGLFLRCGYLQDPSQSYHLEFVLPGRWHWRRLRQAARVLRLPVRFCQRRGRVVAYIKSRRGVRRFLHALELFDRAVELADMAATRDLLGRVNREVNCETANINKVVTAADHRIDEIRALLALPDQEFWSDNLLFMAKARVEHPLDSLEVLGQRLSPPLSKSAVNHRLRRISELYRRLLGPRRIPEGDSGEGPLDTALPLSGEP
jgi:hypothetical protein